MKKTWMVAVVFIIYIVCLNSCAATTELDMGSKREIEIAVVLKMSYGYHWGSVKLGADAAAREFNVNIQYYAPDNEDDYCEQIKLVNEALKRNIDALILAASDYNALTATVEGAYSLGIPVIIIDSEVNTDKVHSFIAADNLEDGKKAGNMLLDIVGENADIAIMNFVKGTKNAEQREEGLMSVISKYPGIKVKAKEYCLSSTTRAYELTKKIIRENENINAIVALNSISCEGVARAVEEAGLSGKVKIIAFDSSIQGINYLENGTIQAMIIQNPFSMGYLSVKYAYDAIEGKRIPKHVTIDSKVVDKQNMYLPENQKLLFPIVN